MHEQVAQLQATQRQLQMMLEQQQKQNQQQQMHQQLVSKLTKLADDQQKGVVLVSDSSEKKPIRRGKDDADVERLICNVHATKSTQQCLERAAQLPVFTQEPIVCRWTIDPKRGMIFSVTENASMAPAELATALLRKHQSTSCGTVTLIHDEETNARVKWLRNQSWTKRV